MLMDRSGPPVNFFYMDLLRPSIVLNGAADVSGHVFLKKTSACSSPPPPQYLPEPLSTRALPLSETCTPVWLLAAGGAIGGC